MSGNQDLDGDPSRLFELEPGDTVTLYCLMPNGIVIPLTVYKDAPLRTIKERLWDEARKYPLASLLHSRESYVFVCISDCAEQEEIDDEGRSVGDVRPFCSVLKVKYREQQGPMNEQALASRISHLIGKGIHELNAVSDSELQDFRMKMKRKCEDIAADRDARAIGTPLQLVNCPPDMCDTELDEACLAKLSNNGRDAPKILFAVSVPVVENDDKYAIWRFLVSCEATADELIRQVLVKKRENLDLDKSVDVQCSNYMLKVCGREEYLLHPAGHHRPLHHFQYIRSRIMKNEIPQLVLVARPPTVPRRSMSGVPSSLAPPTPAPRVLPGRRELCLWEVAQNYYLTVMSLHRVNIGTGAVVRLQVGLYHGHETLCDIVETNEATVENNEVHFNEKLVFGIRVCDLPRMTKLTATLLLVRGGTTTPAVVAANKNKSKKQRGADGPVVLGCMVFMALDYKGVLIRGEKSFYMWPAETVRADESTLSPTGAPQSSPLAAFGATTVKLKLADYGFDLNMSVTYPAQPCIIECAAKQRPAQIHTQTSCSDRDTLSALLKRDPLQTFHEQEKEIIWQSREDIRYEFPECLPKLLSCLRWGCHADVSQMYALLQIWPQLSVDVSLELLDFLYPDKWVREFAVNCLKKSMSDSELYRYLLQLVQAIKFEPYADSDLVNFLLERALHNRRIGHAFFWLLRAEMHRPSVSTRFGIILEAYFYGAKDHMKQLRKQLDALGKLQNINQLIAQYKKERERGIKDMCSILKEQAYIEALSDLLSPHDPAVKLGTLLADRCRYMDSKMKPLWLTWSNADPTGTDIYLIFKSGDDLRQDMLTLQMIAIMDSIWLASGLDLRMSAYGCLCTGRRAGLIEVVQDAETIANIQKRNAGATLQSAFKRESLYAWLKEHNTTAETLKKAVEEFTQSCAGYCVVTYVLGIGDRHSDNIMLKKNGQLFHIDFGHFLGNFKSKFGIKRERVPFVLTNDFVYIINGGRADSKDSSFQRFKETCEMAFKLLRQRGSLIIALFMMMLSTGIPELQSLSDIKYLQETLVLHLSEEDALRHFENKFNEALKNSWKTSFNWAVHNVARDNA